MNKFLIADHNLIDLSKFHTSTKMLITIDELIDKYHFSGKKLKFNLGNAIFTSAYMCTFQTMLENAGSEIELIYTQSEITESSAKEAGLPVQRLDIPVEEIAIEISDETPELLGNLINESSIFEEIKELKTLPTANEVQQLQFFETEMKIEIVETAEEIKELKDSIESEEILSEEKKEPDKIEEYNSSTTEIISEIKTETLGEVNEVDEIEDDEEVEKALEKFLEKETNEQSIKILEKKEDYSTKTTYIKQTLRSGQNVNFDGNVFIIGDCKPGSEITASGDITVWGVLSGIAHAGAKGNVKANIRALKINAIQLRIANLFSRRPDSMLKEKTKKTESFTPEEARITNGEIKIFTLKNNQL